VRLRPTHAGHVWSYDFVSARTHDGLSVRMLNLIDVPTINSAIFRKAVISEGANSKQAPRAAQAKEAAVTR
jgi:hypothetical protein